MCCFFASPLLSLHVECMETHYVWILFPLAVTFCIGIYKVPFCKHENWTQSYLSCRSFMRDVRWKSFTEEVSLFAHWWYLPLLFFLTIFHVSVFKINSFPLSHILLSACPLCIINIFWGRVLRCIWSGYEYVTWKSVDGGIAFYSVEDGVVRDTSLFTIPLPNIIVVPP
jgi:hypothetical protein